MSTHGIYKDNRCKTLGFSRNPPRRTVKTLSTCYSPKEQCTVCAKAFVQTDGSTATLIAGFGFATLQASSNTTILTLNKAPVKNNNYRFIQATVIPEGGGAIIVSARFVDTEQLTIHVETTTDAGDPQLSTSFSLTVCECVGAKIEQPMV